MATNETKWTAGPWRYAKTNGSPTHGVHMIAGAQPGYLAEVRDCGSGSVTANAALIAASPELAAACRELVEWADDGTSSVEDQSEALSRVIEAARAALNKAVRS